MFDIQDQLFTWARHWSEVTAAVVFLIGMLCVLQGYRFARIVLALSCGVFGLALGLALASAAKFPPMAGWLSALVLAGLAFRSLKTGVFISSVFTFALLGHWLAMRFGINRDLLIYFLPIGAVIGIAMYYACRYTMPILLTTLVGSWLALCGFIGLMFAFLPSLGKTFIEWSGSIGLMTPIFIVMLCVIGVSIQTNDRQGSIEAGGSGGFDRAELT